MCSDVQLYALHQVLASPEQTSQVGRAMAVSRRFLLILLTLLNGLSTLSCHLFPGRVVPLLNALGCLLAPICAAEPLLRAQASLRRANVSCLCHCFPYPVVGQCKS